MLAEAKPQDASLAESQVMGSGDADISLQYSTASFSGTSMNDPVVPIEKRTRPVTPDNAYTDDRAKVCLPVHSILFFYPFLPLSTHIFNVILVSAEIRALFKHNDARTRF